MSSNANSVTPSKLGSFDIERFLLVCWRGRGFILLTSTIVSIIFVLATMVMTPIYRSYAVVIPATSDRSSIGASLRSAFGQFGDIASLAGINVGGGDSTVVEALAVLQSREFVEQFIGTHELMQKLYAEKFDVGTHQWKPGVKVPTPSEAYKKFSKHNYKVFQDKKTGLVTVQIDWKDRVEAADWANDIVAEINLEMRNRAMDKAAAYLSFLEKELSSTSVVETREAINRLIELQERERMLASVSRDYSFRIIDKALPSDVDDPLKPTKGSFALMGLLVGMTIASIYAWIRDLRNTVLDH